MTKANSKQAPNGEAPKDPRPIKTIRLFADVPAEIHLTLSRLALDYPDLNRSEVYTQAFCFAAAHPNFRTFIENYLKDS